MGENIFGHWEPEPEPRFSLIRAFKDLKETFWDGEGVFERIVAVSIFLMLSSMIAIVIYLLILLITGKIK